MKSDSNKQEKAEPPSATQKIGLVVVVELT